MQTEVNLEDITLEDVDMALEILRAIKLGLPENESVLTRGINVAETPIYSIRNPYVDKFKENIK